MNRTVLLLASIALLLAAGCGATNGHVTTPSGATSSGSGTPSGTGIGSVASSSGLPSGASSGSSGTAAGTTSGSAASNSVGAGTSGSPASSGTSSTACTPDGVAPGTGGASACCSGSISSAGFCTAGGTVGTTGTSGTTTGPTTTGTTNGGLFGGGWFPADAGYQPALTGDGGTLILVDPSAPQGASGMFTGTPTSTGGPSIVYPPNGVLMPPNVEALAIQFIPGAGQTAFQITFTAPGETLVVYTGCTAVGGGCSYATDATDFWGSLVQYARGGAPVTFSIAGVNASSPSTPAVSASQSMSFSDQSLTSGVYYWNTEGAIERFDWGYPTVAPEAWLSPANTGAICVGCHALSREGDLAAIAANIPEPAVFGLWEVATTTPFTVNGEEVGSASEQVDGGPGWGANFFSFAPDGSLMLQSDGIAIYLMDVLTGQVDPTPVIGNGTMPDWSPSGTQMVYAEGPPPFFPFGTPTVQSASIQRAPYNGTTFGSSTTLVPFQSANNYYPAIDPTGTWVAYNVSPSNNDSFDNGSVSDGGVPPDGELWVVPLAGGTPIRLATASDPGSVSWPKWAPVVNNYAGGQQVMWLTFGSLRAYGLGLPAYQNTQLWMVGFDPAKAAAGQDASFPAFYLPFQDSTSGNHIAQWVTSVIRPPCTSNSQCPTNQVCKSGRCAPNITNKPNPHALGEQVRDWIAH